MRQVGGGVKEPPPILARAKDRLPITLVSFPERDGFKQSNVRTSAYENVKDVRMFRNRADDDDGGGGPGPRQETVPST